MRVASSSRDYVPNDTQAAGAEASASFEAARVLDVGFQERQGILFKYASIMHLLNVRRTRPKAM